jgi:SAM-dependent methyltransferase
LDRAAPPSAHDEAREFYEDFSLAVGQRDWLVPNLRHEQLRLLIDELLAGRDRLRLADVGCGAGVLTDHLRRYGSAVGVDFSSAAIAEAQRLAPRARFLVGGLEALPDDRYDVITLFDVLEHIPPADRPQLFRDLRERLASDGLLFVSTPFPSATRQRREEGDDGLQIIDEEVELPRILEESAAAGLQLLQFRAYDVFAGSPEYQAMVFAPTRSFGGPAALRPAPLQRRKRIIEHKQYRRARRALLAARALAAGDRATARWFVRGQPPQVKS